MWFPCLFDSYTVDPDPLVFSEDNGDHDFPSCFYSGIQVTSDPDGVGEEVFVLFHSTETERGRNSVYFRSIILV